MPSFGLQFCVLYSCFFDGSTFLLSYFARHSQRRPALIQFLLVPLMLFLNMFSLKVSSLLCDNNNSGRNRFGTVPLGSFPPSVFLLFFFPFFALLSHFPAEEFIIFPFSHPKVVANTSRKGAYSHTPVFLSSCFPKIPLSQLDQVNDPTIPFIPARIYHVQEGGRTHLLFPTGLPPEPYAPALPGGVIIRVSFSP